MHKRWYDADPAISLAVSLVQSTNEQNQLECAEYIINFAKQRNIKPKAHSLNDAFNYILRRWYDKDDAVAEAFSYFEAASPDIQKEIALEIIDHLQDLEH